MSEPKTSITRRGLIGLSSAAAVGALAGRVTGQGKSSPALVVENRRRFQDKVVIITGATSGIGRAAPLQFAVEGGEVGFCGRREGLGREVENEIKTRGGEAAYIRADLRNESDVKAFVDQVAQKYGRIDVAFNNAGITIEKPLHEYSSQEWDDVVNTNLRGVFLSITYEIPYLLRNGGGNIVVTSSSNAIATTEKRSAYTASKRGLVGLVQSVAQDYAEKGIRINTLIPGTTDTALVRRSVHMENAPDAVWEVAAAQWAKSHVPGLGRMAEPEEIAAFALALASDEFPYDWFANGHRWRQDRPCRMSHATVFQEVI